jgi:hydroxymethylpyrimidine/phosphomethylpyrimidine kinase
MSHIPPPIALTIAGSDSSGGAGLQADLKVFQQLRVFGTTVVTLITAQNTGGVSGIQLLSPEIVQQQLHAVHSDVPPLALKTGALGSIEIMEVVADGLKMFHCPKVIDPVMVSKHGHPLIDDNAVTFFRKNILPLADLVTPNRFELQRLVGHSVDSVADALNAARQLRDIGVKNCLLKLGQAGDSQRLLALISDSAIHYEKSHLVTRSLHGTGCALSANITARLALSEPITEAISNAIHDIHLAIQNAPSIGQKARNGEGFGPIDMHFSPSHL